MYNRQQDGFYGRTEAFGLLKNFLGIPRSATINKEFFSIFFVESHAGYFIVKPEEEVKKIFEENGLRVLNQQYFKAKKSGNDDERRRFAQEIFSRARNGVHPTMEKSKPYFVK